MFDRARQLTEDRVEHPGRGVSQASSAGPGRYRRPHPIRDDGRDRHPHRERPDRHVRFGSRGLGQERADAHHPAGAGADRQHLETFTASIILQLVTEGKIKLDDSVDTYLPGLLKGDGVDGRAITVREILQHRSGLPELTDFPEINEYKAAVTGRTFTPAEEVAIALQHPAQFPPGAQFKYTNTNYIVAGMIVEKVTGRPYSEELQGRIITPNQLSGTYLPGTRELDIRGPHPEGYAIIDGARTDVTRQEPSVAWTAGAMISTGADLNRFFLALLAGHIVTQAQLHEMLATKDAPGIPMQYGLGIGSTDLGCGAKYFGHTGGISGFVTLSGASDQGRAITIAMTGPFDKEPDFLGLMKHALCP
ncbi:serine hydrolase domain-containing protein [Nocardia sp. NPDC020380]|uniref:serine hydrolase domain-containing protein n=1 Tax=Nocardia sp. NPDC020380 TaxID=3364309 RepID=UPI0037B42973